MKIIFECENYIVIHKEAGLATQTAKLGQKDVISEIKNYLSKSGQKNPYIAVINRLDQPVEGIVLLAKNEKSAAAFSKQLTDNEMEKYYEALVYGNPDKEEGILTDYLLKDARTNTSKVVSKGQKGAKEAILEYKTIEKNDNSLLRVHLITGRHHQIRLQMANMGHPILGDTKYGNKESLEISKSMKINTVMLKAVELRFKDPQSKKDMIFTIDKQTV